MESADVEKAWRCVLQHDVVELASFCAVRLVVANAAPLRERRGGRHAALAAGVPAPLPVSLVDPVPDPKRGAVRADLARRGM